jgi:tetratricopeptide (TPR) repeat protein
VARPAETVEAARARQQRGLHALFRGQPKEAERLLLGGLKVLDAVPMADGAQVRAHIMITLGYAEFELYGLDAALARLDQAAQLVHREALASLQVLLHSQRGGILLRVGRHREALAEFDAGTAALSDAGRADRCRILQNRAVAHMEIGAFAAARSDLERCLTEAGEPELLVHRIHATHNLGYVEFLTGNLPRALRLMDEAFALDSSIAPGTALLGKAEVLVEAGLLHEADDVLAVACETLRRGRVSHDLAEAELERARCAAAMGDLASARRFASSARDRFRRRGNDGWRRSAELVLLQAEVGERRVGNRVTQRAERLFAEMAELAPRLPARMAGLITAEAQLTTGGVDRSLGILAELGAPSASDPITGRMHWHYVHAKVDAALGAATAASQHVRRALDDLARYQARFGSIDLRTASAVHGRRLAELDVSPTLHSGRAASVFAAAERARAVSSRLPPVRPPDDPVAAELLAELRQTLESLRAVEQDKAASEPLLRTRRELERQIVARSWTVSGSGSVTKPASLAAVRAAVAERDETMVTYVQAGGTLSAVVVGGRARLIDLGPSAPVIEQVRRARADLDVLAHPRLPSGIRAAVLASLSRSLGDLDAALLAPLGADGPLVLVSTGVLGQLPWASLPSLRGRPLVVAPSATKWLGSLAAEPTGAVSVTALAGPDLRRGDAEAVAVGAAWPKAEVVHRATTEALTEAMRSATVLHVAAHGVHQPENPLFSSVRMVDGPVFAHELDQKAHAPEHVVLSACEVGLTTIRPGDEALGLASVLLHLGTRSVIAGVARVGDEVAEQTMAAYHAKLAAGSDSSVALAAALGEVDTDVVPPFVNFGAAWAPNQPGKSRRNSPGASADLEPASALA